jgi:hypothetical protein
MLTLLGLTDGIEVGFGVIGCSEGDRVGDLEGAF